jgi:hypothetical protein
MSAGVSNLAIEQGSTFRQRVTWNQPGGSPQDLSGSTAHMQIRAATLNTVLANLTDTAGLTLGGALGTIDIVITAAQTMLLVGARAVYDLIVTLPSGDVVRLIEGTVQIDPLVTVSA